MSIILDALKKLDRENLLRHSGMPNIAAEILRPDPPLPGRRILIYIVVIALTAVATAALTYGVVVFRSVFHSSPPVLTRSPAPPQQERLTPLDSGSPLKASTPALTNSPASSQQASSAPSSSSSLSKSLAPAPLNPSASNQQVAPAPLSPEPVPDVRSETNPAPLKIQKPAENKKPEPSVNEKEPGQDVSLEVEPPTLQTPTGPAINPASLRLSAIVWHEDRSKRIAVINGSITTEGSVLQGVKVEEIYADRVRLSQNGRLFELSLR